MGFYGNITNTSKTQFQFDKIYSSRYEMDAHTYTDGIYAGRYVLVEYDNDYQQDDFYRVWIFNDKLYNTKVEHEDLNYLIHLGVTSSSDTNKLSSIAAGTIVFTADDKTSSESGYQYNNVQYYQITDEEFTDGHAGFKKIIEGSNNPNYTINYNIDISVYGAGRGYDSTVWQKAYIDNVEKYIMIAELNSVVPTFGISADAPTMDPLVPHFDTSSTDIYYKLHWQPAWGFRVAEGETDSRKTLSDDAATGTYPSDIDVSYNRNAYDASTGKNTITSISYPGAIYFNKDGLDETIHNEYTGEFKDTNEISIQPTGKSGNLYNTHDGSLEVKEAPDIQEMKVLLPALGNTVCAIWDKVYGYNQENNNKRYRDLEWKDAMEVENGELKKFEGLTSPVRDSKWEKSVLGGRSYDTETIAGCINLTHDLLGMILTSKELVANKETYALNKIFFDKIDKKYYRLYRYPLYEEVDISGVITLDPSDYTSDQEYNADFELKINNILKDYPDEDWYLVIDKTDDNWQVQRFNKKALTAKIFNGEEKKSLAHIARLSNGDIQYGYKKQEIKGFATDLSTINGLILELKNLIESDDSETRNRETVQGTINTLNDIINIFEDLVPGEFLICDANGHVNSANWTTAQKYSYNNIGNSNDSLPESNENDSLPESNENQWIKVDLDEDNRLISITHQAHKEKDTEHESDINGSSDVISLYSPIVDNTGHIVGNHTEIVTLPYGYKYLETDGRVDEEEIDLYTNPIKDNKDNITGYEINKKTVEDTEKTAEAENTQDKIIINPKNKWIQTQITNNTDSDTIIIAHEVHNVDKVAIDGKTDLNDPKNESPNELVIQDMSFDAAGHITANKAHTYVLPYSFRNITNKSTSEKTGDAASNDGTISAVNTQDTLKIAPSNKWIKTSVANKTLSLGHTVNSITTKAKDETNLNDKINDTSGNATIIQNTFTVNDITNDAAGHITANQSHTYKLPDGYKIIKTINTSTLNEIKIETSPSDNGQIASDTQDTITIEGANHWIKVGDNNKIIKIYHNSPETNNKIFTTEANVKNVPKDTSPDSPLFGQQFDIPRLSHDNAGHISGVDKYSIKLPQPSVTPNTEGNVMTGISVNSSTGVFTQDKVNVGALGIAEFSADQGEVDAGNAYTLKTSDSINGAFKKLQDRIKVEEATRASEITKAVNNLDVKEVKIGAANTIASLAETDGEIIIGEVTSIQIEQSQVTGLSKALENLLNKITDLEDEVNDLKSKLNS